jgi:hypothetical protein
MSSKHSHTAISGAGLLIALGIIYGDIGTSPLYVMSSILKSGHTPGLIDEALVLGGISCVIWTLTLQTTIKYVLLTSMPITTARAASSRSMPWCGGVGPGSRPWPSLAGPRCWPMG